MPVNPPGAEVAVYVVTAEPPLDAGSVNATVADVDPAAATASTTPETVIDGGDV